MHQIDRRHSVTRQRRIGYALLAFAGIIVVAGAGFLFYYGYPLATYLGPVVPAVIVAFAGVRYLRASRDGEPVRDERTVRRHGKTSQNAFVGLLLLMSADLTVSIVPDDYVRICYLLAGVTIYVAFYSYFAVTTQ